MQYRLSASDAETVLALVRDGTLAVAASRLGVDPSTVFRTVGRMEKGLGYRLFERTRSGYLPTEAASAIARHAERIEAELDAARGAAQSNEDPVSGTIRLTTTDTILHGLVLPALATLGRTHPKLALEATASNELASLTKRDADIALRATARAPDHLVGRRLGPIRVALFAPRTGRWARLASSNPAGCEWIAPDDALPDHPSVRWRRRHCPRAIVRLKVNSILSVTEAIAAGLGVGIVPLFLADGRRDLVQASDPLAECESQLWLLTHPEFRHLRRIAAVYAHLADAIALD